MNFAKKILFDVYRSQINFVSLQKYSLQNEDDVIPYRNTGLWTDNQWWVCVGTSYGNFIVTC